MNDWPWSGLRTFRLNVASEPGAGIGHRCDEGEVIIPSELFMTYATTSY